MATWEIKDIVALIGIGATFCISLAVLIFGLHNNKKTIFINSVTTSRIRYMEAVRNSISEFCGLSLNITLTDIDESEKKKTLEKIDFLRFQIQLFLDREHNFDKKIIEKIKIIPDLANNPKKISELENELAELVYLTQNLLKNEWNGVKQEVLKGNLSTYKKKELENKYLFTEKLAR